MKYCSLTIGLVVMLTASACGQATATRQHKPAQQTITMDTSKLTHPVVKAAFDAWQKGDAKTFLSFFAAGATLTDDGQPRDLSRFVKDACGHERFTGITKVENGGKDIYGRFHTESWGDFNTFFKFTVDSGGKITRLDIGQAH